MMHRKLTTGFLIALLSAILAHGCVDPPLPGFPCTEDSQCGTGYACRQLRPGCQKLCVSKDGPPPSCGLERHQEPGPSDQTDEPLHEPSRERSDAADRPETSPQEPQKPEDSNDIEPCKNGETRSCERTPKSLCATRQTCQKQRWGPCQPVSTGPETCGDNLDNDCDGKVDEECICKDGETRPCYDARTGCTKTNGSYTCNAPCAAGTQTCQGNVWGSCEGQTYPKSQDLCNSGLDDDCDGSIAVAPDACAWLQMSTGPGTYILRQMIQDAAGNLYIIGLFTDAFQLGSTKIQLSSQYEPHAFIAKLDRAGQVQWLRWYGYERPDLKENYLRFQAIARLDRDQLVVAGTFSGRIIERTTAAQKTMPALAATGLRDVFVFSLSAKTGDFQQVLTTATGTNQDVPLAGNELSAMVVDSQGNIHLVGTFRGKLTWGAFTITSQGKSDIFLARLNSKGTPQQLKQFGTAGTESLISPHSLALDGQDRLYLTGSCNGDDAVQGNYQVKGLQSTQSTSGNQSFITALDAKGNTIWSQLSQGAGRVKVEGVHISASDKYLYLFGIQRGSSKLFDPGSTTYPNSGQGSSWLTQYSLPGHTHQWTRNFPSPSEVHINGLATNKADQIYVVGGFVKLFKNPIKDLVSAGRTDGFVAHFNDKGNMGHIVPFGGSATDRAVGVVVDQQQQVYVGAHIQKDAKLLGVKLPQRNDSYSSMFLWKPQKKTLTPP